jgi:hypothetical protein
MPRVLPVYDVVEVAMQGRLGRFSGSPTLSAPELSSAGCCQPPFGGSVQLGVVLAVVTGLATLVWNLRSGGSRTRVGATGW